MVIYKNHYKTVKSVILNLVSIFAKNVIYMIWIQQKTYTIVTNVGFVDKLEKVILITVTNAICVIVFNTKIPMFAKQISISKIAQFA